MVDLHCHILFDIDDGADTLSTSLRMCRIAAENGIERIAATPHVTKLSNISKFIERRNERLDSLREAVDKAGIPVEICPGAEVYVSDDIFYADDLSKITLNNSRYLLVEFDFFGLSSDRFLKYLDEIYSMGLIPVIAHPERYSHFQRDYNLVNYLSQRDVIFQINAVNLTRSAGYEENSLAHQMALTGIATVIASDAHSSHGRSNDLMNMINAFPRDIGNAGLDYMLNTAPNAILDDEPIPFTYKGMIKRRRGF